MEEDWPNVGSDTTVSMDVNTSEPADIPSDPANGRWTAWGGFAVYPTANYRDTTRLYTDLGDAGLLTYIT